MKPDKILLCEPRYFDVTYIGNKFMDMNRRPDKTNALAQWNELKNTYLNLGYDVQLIKPQEEFPDMVFTANQSLPFTDKNGNKKVILSRMRNKEREGEVNFFREFYTENGYEIIELPENIEYFESMGDAVIDYERSLLFGGFGQRTQKEVYDFIRNVTPFNVITLELINPYLYHLDTCLSVLNKNYAVVDETAFNKNDLDSIKNNFENVISVLPEENLRYFVCNCHCPDGENVIVQKGSIKFKDDIIQAGFNLIEIDTSEFIKSGGSVFCMKMMML